MFSLKVIVEKFKKFSSVGKWGFFIGFVYGGNDIKDLLMTMGFFFYI